jgi:hypothetical protein
MPCFFGGRGELRACIRGRGHVLEWDNGTCIGNPHSTGSVYKDHVFRASRGHAFLLKYSQNSCCKHNSNCSMLSPSL